MPWLEPLFGSAQTEHALLQLLGLLGHGPLARPELGYHQRPHANGWVESERRPADTTIAMPLYEHRFQRHQVDPELVAALLERVRSWTASGVRVFAFRVPASREMEALEDSRSGFREAAFAQELEAAGGTWLTLPGRESMHTHDGSHLDAASARRLGTELGQAISLAIPPHSGSCPTPGSESFAKTR